MSMSLKTSKYLYVDNLYVNKGKKNAISVDKSHLNLDNDLSKAKLISKKIRKHLPSTRQLLKLSALIQLPMIVLLPFLLFSHVKMFILGLAVLAIAYFWIDVAEVFAEAKVLTKKYLIGYSLIGVAYLVLSLFLGTKSLYNLIEFSFASSTAFCIFKGYNLIMRGLVGKNITLLAGSLISLASLGVTILLFNLSKIAF